jgi:hypothetical protein
MADEALRNWIGQEVTVSYGFTFQGNDEGVLESASEQGVVLVRDGGTDDQLRLWIPTTSIVYIRLGVRR